MLLVFNVGIYLIVKWGTLCQFLKGFFSHKVVVVKNKCKYLKEFKLA